MKLFICLVIVSLVARGHPTCQETSTPFWSNVLYFNRGRNHEALDPFDVDGALVSEPQTFCHGNHCNYFRQPLTFVCAHREHFALLNMGTVGAGLNDRKLSKIGDASVAEDAKGTARRLVMGHDRSSSSQKDWPPKIDASTILAMAKFDPAEEQLAEDNTSASDTYINREMGQSVRSYTRYSRYNPLDEEELAALIPTNNAGEAATAQVRWLAGAFEEWQPAAVARFALPRKSAGHSVGHPLHSLRFVAHSSGGTYAKGGNQHLARLLSRRERQRKQSVLELEPMMDDSSASIPWDLDLSLSDWVCSPRRPALMEDPYTIENIHVVCAATEEVMGSATKEQDWDTIMSSNLEAVWGADVFNLRAAQSTYGEFMAGTCPSFVNTSISHHCALHYHIVNYGDPKAKMGAVGLAIATVALVVVMLFFVSGRWYHEKVARHKTRALLRRMDKEAIAKRRAAPGAPNEKDEEYELAYGSMLPSDVTQFNAAGGSNALPMYGGGAIDPMVIKSLKKDADDQGLRRRRMAGIDSQFNKNKHPTELSDPVLISSRSGSVLGGMGNGAGRVFNNPNQFTLGELLGAGGSLGGLSSSGRFSQLSPSSLGVDYVSMPLDIGVTPKKIPSPTKRLGKQAEMVQTVAIDEY